ncbi:MAG: hypothetical protein R3Y38_06610 [Rikenellaceae bacterium]
MKKLFLALLVAMFALQVAPVAAAAPAAKKVAAMNKQVGGTLTDEQKAQLTEIYSAPAEEGVAPKAANRAKKNQALGVLTEEQKEAIKAAAQAKKAAQAE